MFHHLKQHGKNCGWYVLYSITGDRRALDYCGKFGHDLMRWVIRSIGWDTEVYWNQLFDTSAKMPKGLWTQLFDSKQFLVSDNNAHRVALYFENQGVIVSDPKFSDPQFFTLEGFLISKYADTMYLARIYLSSFEDAMATAEDV